MDLQWKNVCSEIFQTMSFIVLPERIALKTKEERIEIRMINKKSAKRLSRRTHIW